MNVNIDINTRQEIGDNEVDIIRLKTTGKIYYKKDGVYVIYKEADEGFEVTNTIKIKEGEISIKKYGHVNSLMTFNEGVLTTTKYKTPQGVFFMDVKTNSLSIAFNEDDSVQVNINYNIVVQDLFSGVNDINIKIFKAE